MMDIKFKPVDFHQHKDICLDFRRDAHRMSYGSIETFSAGECLKWFESLLRENPAGFKHVCQANKIIGQIEFKSAIADKNGSLSGYINLLYLLPEYRRQGYGLQLQNYIFSQFITDNCSLAYLRYLPANLVAGNFYKKNGWVPDGEPNERGQLMMHSLF